MTVVAFESADTSMRNLDKRFPRLESTYATAGIKPTDAEVARFLVKFRSIINKL